MAADAPTLRIRAAFKTGQDFARVFWSRHGEKGHKGVVFPVKSDGEYRTYEVKLADSTDYTGVITGLRIELVEHLREGDGVKVEAIGFR
jgi:hypothetical protein